MDTVEDLRLEWEADRLLQQIPAHDGEYPAYRESDLRRKAEHRREALECDLGAGPDREDFNLLESGIALYDPSNPIDARSRIRPGYDILLLLLMYASELTPRRQTLVELTMAGLNIREASRQAGVSAWSSSKDLNAAISAMKARREELEDDYDLERTAQVLHLQRTWLPCSGSVSSLRPSSRKSPYMRNVRRVMLGATKPILVSISRTRQYDRHTLKRLALTLRDCGYTRSACRDENSVARPPVTYPILAASAPTSPARESLRGDPVQAYPSTLPAA